jgi:hypothetical protein
MRYRDKFMFVGTGVVLLALFASDPDVGVLNSLPFFGSTLAGLLIYSKAIIGVAFTHYARKALFDYPEADLQILARRALASPEGAGMFAIAIAIIFAAIAYLVKT